MNPPFLNGLAVFAHKHALALAHASGGGKCKRRVPYPKGARRAVCTSEAGKIRVPLSRARGSASQEGLVSLLCAERMEMLLELLLRSAFGAGTSWLLNSIEETEG